MRLQEHWRRERIKDVALRVTVGFVGPQAPHFVEEGVPLLRGQNVRPGALDLASLRFIARATHERWSKSSLQADDVVIVRVGYPGAAAVIPPGMGPLNAASLVIVRPNRDLLDPHFLAYLINSAWGRIAVSARLVGSAQQVLNTNAVADLEIQLPPIAEQRAIARVLRAFDLLIENNRRRIDVLERMAQAIYQEWFVRYRYPGHQNATFTDSRLGAIPEGWEIKNLFELAEVGFGFAYKSKHFSMSGPFPVIRIRDVPAGMTKTFSDEPAPERYRVVDGDILIGMDGDFHMRQWSGGESWLNQRVARLRPRDGLSARHLMLGLDAPVREWNAAITGTTVAHLGKSHLEQIQLAMPPFPLLCEAAELFDGIAEEERALQQTGRILAATRDLLLPRLVTGQIDVSHLDLNTLEASLA